MGDALIHTLLKFNTLGDGPNRQRHNLMPLLGSGEYNDKHSVWSRAQVEGENNLARQKLFKGWGGGEVKRCMYKQILSSSL